ncbi:hypothetical protein KEF85_08615 [Methylomonas paludis]|uniref:Uncharacterized protein n=1 Tax=Methylomonas paludis TaxID=1173101 RepID=A0A975MLB5_9GAMM|nr:hypothetical protein [Methylomonas paludis]QWF69446.1 hypothetical protein KEF85_08615 [Methylomonas paludis]
MNVLGNNIEDEARFIVIGLQQPASIGADKTTILLSTCRQTLYRKSLAHLPTLA